MVLDPQVAANLRLNRDKRKSGVSEVSYLHYKEGAARIYAAMNRVRVIM